MPRLFAPKMFSGGAAPTPPPVVAPPAPAQSAAVVPAIAAPIIPLDFSVYDNLVAVTFQSSTRNAGDVDAIPVAKQRAIRGVEKSPSGGAYAGYECNWLIPQTCFTQGFVPKPGDEVIDGDKTAWTVLTTQLGKFKQTWTLGCVDLVLAAQLQDLIDIQAAASSLDASGALVRAWPPSGGKTPYPKLPCRVQELTADVKEERGIKGTERHFDIYLSRGITVDVRENRILWQKQILDLIKYKDGNRIDVLPTLTAVLKV